MEPPQKRTAERVTTILIWCGMGLVALAIAYLTYRRISNMWALGWHGYLHLMGRMVVDILRAIALVAGVVAVFGALVLAQTVVSKWRRVRVFISFKSENESLAREVKAAIEGRWICAEYLPYGPRDHDAVIEWARDHVRQSDALVVLPGPEQSFVDGEIFAASAQFKAIVFIKTAASQTTPNSALRGYPVFNLEKLRAHGFQPLERFLMYVCGLWRDTVRNFARASSGSVETFLQVVLIYGVFVNPVLRIGTDLLEVFNMPRAISIYMAIPWVGAVMASLVFAYSYVCATSERMRAIRIAKQKIVTREFTFEQLQEGLSYLSADKEILTCLEQAPLPLRH